MRHDVELLDSDNANDRASAMSRLRVYVDARARELEFGRPDEIRARHQRETEILESLYHQYSSALFTIAHMKAPSPARAIARRHVPPCEYDCKQCERRP